MPLTGPLNIGVFDSGVGGLSVVWEIQKAIPSSRFIYCCDNRNYPYGPRPEEEVTSLVVRTATRLTERFELDVLVIACNTASTVVLPALRRQTHLPVVGVVPAIKPAAEMSLSQTLGLIATPGTISRPYTQDLIERFASRCRVIKVSSSRMVAMAEQKVRGLPVDRNELLAEVAPLFDRAFNPHGFEVDTIVLGCTHFPLLLPELKEVSQWPVRWVDSGEAIARRIGSIFADRVGSSTQSEIHSRHIAVFTLLNKDAETLGTSYLKGVGFTEIVQL